VSGVFRVLLTSSRSWTSVMLTGTGHTLDDVLDGVARSSAEAGFHGMRVVHGVRPLESGDWLAELWVRDRASRGWPVKSEPHPAAWKRYRKTAGFRRNAEMVHLGAHLCLAFIDVCQKAPCEDGPDPHPSHGVTNCADLAEGAAIHVQRFEPADVPARTTAGASLPNPERR
jgi:hypothetical protein